MWNVSNLLKRIASSDRYKETKVVAINEDSPEKSSRPPEEQQENHAALISTYKQRKFHAVMQWDPPVLMYLDRLSEAQYTVECRDYYHGRIIDGSYFFYPPIGTLLPAGIHNLKATFIPSNPFKYNSMELIKPVEVKKRRAEVAWNYQGGYVKYLSPLTKDHLYSGLTCDISEGQYEFSHAEGAILDVGTHKLTVCYIPSSSEAMNYCRGYATATIQVIGTIVPVIWELPIDFETLRPDEIPPAYQITYPQSLPAWVFCAHCELDDVAGTFVYSVTKETILPIGYHTLQVVFYPLDKRKYFQSSTSQRVFVFPGSLTLTWPRLLSDPQGDPLDDRVLCCSNTLGLSGRYEYTPCPGTILAIGNHTLSCTFHPADTNYLPPSCSVSYRILDKREVKILWFEPEAIVYSEPLSEMQCNARLVGYGSHEPGTFHYSPPVGTILHSGTHILEVVFQTVKATFKPAKASVTLIVERAKAKLLWKPPDPILIGDRLFDTVLNCICTNTQGTFEYHPPKETTMGESGKHILRVHFQPFDVANYDAADGKVTLEVQERPKIIPRLYWSDPVTPQPLPYGSKLGGRELNATCSNAKGFFLYIPDVDTILPTGRHTLRARFEPDDSHKILADEITSTVIIVKCLPVLRWIPLVAADYELPYGERLTSQNYLTAYVTASETDLTRIPGTITYSPDPTLDSCLECGDRTITCTFTPKDERNYYPLSATKQVFVKRSVPELIWDISSHGPIHYPTCLDKLPSPKLLCSTPIKGKFSYSTDITYPLSVGTHSVTVAFIPHNVINYLGNRVTLTIQVFPTIPKVVWNPLRTVLTYESPLSAESHCNAYCVAPVKGGTFRYSPQIGSILQATTDLSDKDVGDDLLAAATTTLGSATSSSSLEQQEKVELNGGETWETFPDLIPKGKIVIKLTYYPDDTVNYQSITLYRFFTIVKKSPTLSWQYPWKLPYGTPLSKKNILTVKLSEYENSSLTRDQLACGEFQYDPPAGTVVAAGKGREIKVTFLPPAVAQQNYTIAKQTAFVEVLKASPPIKWIPKVLTLFEGTVLNKQEHCNAIVLNSKVFKGKLVYNPPPGTKLSPGRYNVEVKFIPEEAQNVLPITITRPFQVIANTPKMVQEKDPLTGQLKIVKKLK